MVVQAQSDFASGMTAGMNSGAFSGGQGLPASFENYRPAAQVFTTRKRLKFTCAARIRVHVRTVLRM